MAKTLILDEDEIKRLCQALKVVRSTVPVPEASATWQYQFLFIGWMLERMRAGDGYGIELALLGRDSAKETSVEYTAVGCSRDGLPCISTVISNRGPAVAVALAIIFTSEESP